MNVHITARHIHLEPIVRQYIGDRMSRVLRLTDRVQGVHVVIDQVRGGYELEAIAHMAGMPPLAVKVSGYELRGTIDGCEDKLTSLVRHVADRSKHHH